MTEKKSSERIETFTTETEEATIAIRRTCVETPYELPPLAPISGDSPMHEALDAMAPYLQQMTQAERPPKRTFSFEITVKPRNGGAMQNLIVSGATLDTILGVVEALHHADATRVRGVPAYGTILHPRQFG